MVDAICKEITTRSTYLSTTVNTVYFGGGTPSLLSKDQIEQILDSVSKNFDIVDTPEISFEANPEDLEQEYCEALAALGINRLSIGFQTFDNEKLGWMNRAHDASQAQKSLENARNAGFDNISIDLIYALPGTPKTHWIADLATAISLNPEHISLYGLTIEDRTVFGKRKQKGELVELPEETAAKQYLDAIRTLQEAGFNHYEVSNFAKSGFHSRHNSGYWDGQHYLGIGPGAHSFDGISRRLNVANNAKYIKAVSNNYSYFEVEDLSKIQRLNEQILTGLRRAEGIDFHGMKKKFDIDLRLHYAKKLEVFEQQGMVNLDEERLNLTPKGFLVADDIALQLFFDE